MADLKNQRQIAASVLKVGANRIWIDPDNAEEISKAITREDIRELISDNLIIAKPVKGISRGRARKLDIKRAYGHRKGHGSRKGAKGARNPRKRQWMKKIRSLRKRLHEMRSDGTLDKSVYHKMYRKAKGGEYRNVAHMEAHIELIAQREK
ncbi:MAG: 50S ribosomal protein L19e [Methanosarcinales archaeon]|nr:50S ribosomal protein L19e [Methanosarcinales archaeon]